MQQIVTTLVVAAVSYLLLYILEFLWYLLFKAPVVLYMEQQGKIDKLNAHIQKLSTHPYDLAFEAMVKAKVQSASDPAKELLKFLLNHGEMDINYISISTGNHTAVGAECYSLGFVDKREDRPGNGLVARAIYYRLKDNFREVLKDTFYPRSS